MKKIFTLLTVLSVSVLHAQTYLSHNICWSIYESGADGLSNESYKGVMLMYVDGDTTISSIPYYKLMLHKTDSIFDLSNNQFKRIDSSLSYMSAIRETFYKKMYYIQAGTTIEKLWFDFWNLQVNSNDVIKKERS